jgi:peptidoglycan hydrolase-like protein with peptidoglycan-binding domain
VASALGRIGSRAPRPVRREHGLGQDNDLGQECSVNVTRRNLVLVVVGAVAVSAIATLLATALIRSPAEVAARSAPPEPTPILAAVEKRVITTKVVSRGTGRYGSPQDLTVIRSALKTGPQVVTSLPEPAADLAEGAVVLTVSGRPVFLLGGQRPSYRDLGPGVQGADVEQLEAALDRLGLQPGRVDGRYDGSTERAVTELYRRAKFEPMRATQAQLDGVRPVEADLVPGGRASGGVQLPSDEVIFVPTPQVRVSELKAAIGAAPDGPLVAVTDSHVAIDGSLTLDEAKAVQKGMEVMIDEPVLGISVKGTVDRIADRPGTDGADGYHVFFATVVTDPPAKLVGASVRLTIPVRTTGEPVLAVPLSAVSLGPDGSSRVERSVNGQVELVPVQPGVSGDGYVAVSPRAAPLAEGDMVVIGTNGPRDGG